MSGGERIRADWRTVDAPDIEPAADTSGPDDALDLERAIGALPEGARDVFVLHDIMGIRIERSPRCWAVVEGTSKSQLTRARTLLGVRLP